jgi:hypothetical protein
VTQWRSHPSPKEIPRQQGILQGKLKIWGSEARFGSKTSILQQLIEQFPMQVNRENISKISESRAGAENFI